MSIGRKLAVGAATATLGLVLGATVLAPVVAGAQESTTATPEDTAGKGERIRTHLEGLVADGTITSAQADAVAAHLAEALPHRGRHFVGKGRVVAALDTAAEAIGIERSALVDAVRNGQTIAEVATANGTDPQAVIDAMMAAHQAKLDELVASGRLTSEQAARLAEGAVERITGLVNGDFEFRPGFMVRPNAGAPDVDEGA